jgi:RHS repeat-associated protein
MEASYLYDSDGIRVRKVVAKAGVLEQTVYVDGLYEEYSERRLGAVREQKRFAHVQLGPERVALLKRNVVVTAADSEPSVLYHHGDHLGSSHVLTRATGSFYNQEEFYPYGGTSFGGYARKRYRFAGKERDSETALHYHGARYYAPWLARWTSCDPAGMIDGTNLHAYAQGNPVRYTDPTGTQLELAPLTTWAPSAASLVSSGASSVSLTGGSTLSVSTASCAGATSLAAAPAAAVGTATGTGATTSTALLTEATAVTTKTSGSLLGGELSYGAGLIALELGVAVMGAYFMWEAAEGRMPLSLEGRDPRSGEYVGPLSAPPEHPLGSTMIRRLPGGDVAWGRYDFPSGRCIGGVIELPGSKPGPAQQAPAAERGISLIQAAKRKAPEELVMNLDHMIDMREAPKGSPMTALDFPRNKDWFWAQMLARQPKLFSAQNEAHIKAGLAPVVDKQWLKSHPGHAVFVGDFLVHHHVEQGPWAVGIPRRCHQIFHDALHLVHW